MEIPTYSLGDALHQITLLSEVLLHVWIWCMWILELHHFQRLHLPLPTSHLIAKPHSLVCWYSNEDAWLENTSNHFQVHATKERLGLMEIFIWYEQDNIDQLLKLDVGGASHHEVLKVAL